MYKPGTIIFFLFLFLVLLGGIYFIIEKESVKDLFGSSLENSEFAFLEQAFQNEPEKEPTPDSLKIPIFIYHSVRRHIAGESKIQEAYDITPELFEKQLKYLQDNGYTTITLDDLVHDIEQGTTTPVTKPVILTFDDGWRNQYRNAFPLLKKYHMTATFYVYTNPIGKKKHFLTWDQLKEMDAAGMTITSHTLSHPYLKLLSTDELTHEIVESKKILEAELKKPIRHFASPFGYTNSEVVTILKEAGYLTGRTTRKGVYHAKSDLLKLRGILINDDFSDFVHSLETR